MIAENLKVSRNRMRHPEWNNSIDNVALNLAQAFKEQDYHFDHEKFLEMAGVRL